MRLIPPNPRFLVLLFVFALATLAWSRLAVADDAGPNATPVVLLSPADDLAGDLTPFIDALTEAVSNGHWTLAAVAGLILLIGGVLRAGNVRHPLARSTLSLGFTVLVALSGLLVLGAPFALGTVLTAAALAGPAGWYEVLHELRKLVLAGQAPVVGSAVR